jgi:ribulose-phosphate 3-epimerase
MSKLIALFSVLAADFANLQPDCEMWTAVKQTGFIDIMDGVLYKHLFECLWRTLQKHATKTIDCHLMIVDPTASRLCRFRVWQLVQYFEACTHLHRTLQNIKANGGMKAGVALNPHTSVDHLKND